MGAQYYFRHQTTKSGPWSSGIVPIAFFGALWGRAQVGGRAYNTFAGHWVGCSRALLMKSRPWGSIVVISSGDKVGELVGGVKLVRSSMVGTGGCQHSTSQEEYALGQQYRRRHFRGQVWVDGWWLGLFVRSTISVRLWWPARQLQRELSLGLGVAASSPLQPPLQVAKEGGRPLL